MMTDQQATRFEEKLLKLKRDLSAHMRNYHTWRTSAEDCSWCQHQLDEIDRLEKLKAKLKYG